MSLTEQRLVVCHIGDAPNELKEVFANSSFQFIELTLKAALKEKRLRTIIFSFPEIKIINDLLLKFLVKILDKNTSLFLFS